MSLPALSPRHWSSHIFAVDPANGQLLEQLRAHFPRVRTQTLILGCMGPAGRVAMVESK